MFGLFKRKKPYEQEAHALFNAVHEQSRRAEFYADLQVPDTTEGRFSILSLHMFIVMHVLKDIEGGEDVSQSLFDISFNEIDRGYREIGVGDMGIPKRMKKLMLNFNGSMHAYEEGLDDQEKLQEALFRNVYTLFQGTDKELEKLTKPLSSYMLKNIEHLQTLAAPSIMSGNITFKHLNEI